MQQFMLLPDDLLLKIFPLLLYLMKCEWLSGLVKNRAGSICHLCGRWPSTEKLHSVLWTACEWGCVKAAPSLGNSGSKGPPHIAQAEVITSEPLISPCKNSGWGPMCCSLGAQFLRCVFMRHGCLTTQDRWKDRGQSAGTDEFWMCWRWFIRALKRSVRCPSHPAHPLIDHSWNDAVLTNHGTVYKVRQICLSPLYSILNVLWM